MTDKMKSFVTGMQFELCKPFPKKAEQTPEREVVAYLYNGVRLPKLPEWDRGVYPYAYITEPTKTPASGATYFLYTSNRAMVASTGGNGTSGGGYLYEYVDGEWILSTAANGEYLLIKGATQTNGPIVWSNTDVLYNSDNSLYLAASDPEPVYE